MSPRCAYLIRSALKQIGHPCKAINTIDLYLISTSSYIILLFPFLFLDHTGLSEVHREMGSLEGEIAGFEARMYFSIILFLIRRITKGQIRLVTSFIKRATKISQSLTCPLLPYD